MLLTLRRQMGDDGRQVGPVRARGVGIHDRHDYMTRDILLVKRCGAQSFLKPAGEFPRDVYKRRTLPNAVRFVVP